MLDRFYVTERLAQPEIELPPEEAHHALHVLRKRLGDKLTLFDGRGCSATAHIAEIGRKSVRVVIEQTLPREQPPARSVTLGVALPKGERARWLVEKATEIGVNRLIPLGTERSIVDPRPARMAKLRQTVIAACKQSGRNRLMEIEQPLCWGEWIERIPSHAASLVGDGSGHPINACLRELFTSERGDDPEEIGLSIGPEGGFSSDELAAARNAGSQVVNLGDTILRVETAAIVAAGIAMSVLGE